MRNKNVLIILIILVLIALVAATSVIFKSQPEVLPDAGSIVKLDGSAATAGPTVEPSAEATAASSSDATAEPLAEATADPAAQEDSSAALSGAGYVYITAGGEARWFELPAEESKLEITRTAQDGTEIFNVINLSPEGVFVESASCDNQDCVEQGVVTLENKEERVLRNLIVCLPNEVSVELYSGEEVAQMLIEQSQQMSEE